MAEASNLKQGDFIRYNGEVCEVTSTIRRTPAGIGECYQIKLRKVRNGQVLENRFRPGGSVELLTAVTRSMQFVSREGLMCLVMDSETYEQTYLPEDLFGSPKQFLKTDVSVSVLFVDSNPVLATIPDFLDLKVTSTAAPPASAPAAKTLKPAKLETGAEIQVPLVIKNGDIVKVDTRTEEFVSRASSGS